MNCPPTFIYVEKGNRTGGESRLRSCGVTSTAPRRTHACLRMGYKVIYIWTPAFPLWDHIPLQQHWPTPMLQFPFRRQIPRFYPLNFVPFGSLAPLIVNCQFRMWRWKVSGGVTAVPCNRFTVATVYLLLHWTFQDHHHHQHLALQPFVGFRLLSQVSPSSSVLSCFFPVFYTGADKSLADRLPGVFCLMVRIFRLMLVLLYI
jgi:hypothetical protein